MSHIPVLLKEVVSTLFIKEGDRLLDATFGGGGHSRAILESEKCFLIGIDRDPEALLRAQRFKKDFEDRFHFISGKFSQLDKLLENEQKFDGILFDFGISSFQIDDQNRGFSFSKNGILDMRMSNNEGISAFDVINSFSEEDLANIIWTYGEEPKSRKIASAIVKERANSSIDTTSRLREIVSMVYKCPSATKKYSKIDVATKTFQAIRIFVNNELVEIDTALKLLPKILNNGARIATISFHSLEDRIVKNWAKSLKNLITPINKNVIKPTEEEIRENPRSRSAVLRGFIYNNVGENL